MEQQGLLSMAGGDNLAVSYKTKYTLAMWPSSPTLWGLLELTETLRPHENLHAIVYSSFLHNRQNLRTTKKSFMCEWVN